MVYGFGIMLGLAVIIALPSLIFTIVTSVKGRFRFHLTARDGFLLVFLMWLGASFLGTIPFLFYGLKMPDAIFESFSGFTTAGATIFKDLESLPMSLHLYRALIIWFGGMGIVLLSVALMPLLGVGGFQLVKAETPGPDKEKITPKIASTAKFLYLSYAAFTLALFLCYFFGGMAPFDAFCSALSMMAGGGISTKNAGLSFWHSHFIEAVTVLFMLFTATNFSLYYKLLHGKFHDVWRNSELRAFILIFVCSSIALGLLLRQSYGGSFIRALHQGAFQAASILSTTGANISDYTKWPAAAQAILFVLFLIGGCSGSTAGGIKVVRFVVLAKQAGNELRRIIFPRALFSVQINGKVGRKDVIYGTAGFLFLYLLVLMLATIAGSAEGLDLLSSFSASLALLGNTGIGFGAIGTSGYYGEFPSLLKLLYSFVMIAGRLELWTVFVLFTPEYWRR
jgi:trk system potassium uptake protein TrkH